MRRKAKPVAGAKVERTGARPARADELSAAKNGILASRRKAFEPFDSSEGLSEQDMQSGSKKALDKVGVPSPTQPRHHNQHHNNRGSMSMMRGYD